MQQNQKQKSNHLISNRIRIYKNWMLIHHNIYIIYLFHKYLFSVQIFLYMNIETCNSITLTFTHRHMFHDMTCNNIEFSLLRINRIFVFDYSQRFSTLPCGHFGIRRLKPQIKKGWNPMDYTTVVVYQSL